MNITLEQFYNLTIYNYFLRVTSHDVMVFDEDMNSDLIESYIIPTYGKHKIASIECFRGNAYCDGAILEIKLEN